MKNETFTYVSSVCRRLLRTGYSLDQISLKTGLRGRKLDYALSAVPAGNYGELSYPDNVLQVMVALLKEDHHLKLLKCRGLLSLYHPLEWNEEDLPALFSRAMTMAGVTAPVVVEVGPMSSDDIETLKNIYDAHGTVLEMHEVCAMFESACGVPLTPEQAAQILKAEGVDLDHEV